MGSCLSVLREMFCCCQSRKRETNEFRETRWQPENYEQNRQVVISSQQSTNYEPHHVVSPVHAESPGDLEYRRHLEEVQRRKEQRLNDFLKKTDMLDAERARKRIRLEEENRNNFAGDLKRMREENDRKNQRMYSDVEQGNTPTSTSNGQSEWDRLQNEYKIQQINEEMEENRRIHEKQINNLDDMARQEELEHQQQKQAISEDFLKRREQLQRDSEIKRRLLNDQFERIMHEMRQKLWNEICERNWTDRLNMLRDANKDSKELERKCLGSRVSINRFEEWLAVLEILKQLMRDEDENMTKAFRFSKKQFLLEIQKCVQLVAQKADSLIWGLQIHEDDVQRLSSLASGLNRACLDIPSLAELKEKYSSDMANPSSL